MWFRVHDVNLSLIRLPVEILVGWVVFVTVSFFRYFLFLVFSSSHCMWFLFWSNEHCGYVYLIETLNIDSKITSFGVRMLRIALVEVFAIRFVKCFIVIRASWPFWVLWINNLKLETLPLRASQKIIEVWLKKCAIWSLDDENIAFGSFKDELSVLQRYTGVSSGGVVVAKSYHQFRAMQNLIIIV